MRMPTVDSAVGYRQFMDSRKHDWTLPTIVELVPTDEAALGGFDNADAGSFEASGP